MLIFLIFWELVKIWTFFFWLFLRCWRLENRRGWYARDANVYNNPIWFVFMCHFTFDTIFNISCLHHILKTIWWHILTTLFIRFVSSSIPFFIFFFLGGDLTIKGSWISMGIFMANPMSMAKEIPITKLMLFEINVFPDLVYQFEFGTPIWKMDFLNNKLKLLLILLLKSLQTYLTITRIDVT